MLKYEINYSTYLTMKSANRNIYWPFYCKKEPVVILFKKGPVKNNIELIQYLNKHFNQ